MVRSRPSQRAVRVNAGFIGSPENVVCSYPRWMLCSSTDMPTSSEVDKIMSQALAWLQIMVVSTTAFLVAGRFGLAPTLRQQATSGLRLVDNGTKGLSTGDPSGIQLCRTPFCTSSSSDWFPEPACKLSQTCCAFKFRRAYRFVFVQVSQLLMFLGMEPWDTLLVPVPSSPYG